jgi:diguanylate cyclase (GGDEF)-like protein
MISSVAAVIALAIFMLAIGVFSGWSLRGRCRGQSVAERVLDSFQPGRKNDNSADETSAPCVRNTFSLALGHRLAESSRHGDPLSLIIVRIDDYQALRDRFGLNACNEILDAVGKFFISSVRGSDWVARFDMTTFALLLPKTEHSNALCVAERLLTSISSASLTANGVLIPLTLSLGTTEAMRGDSSDEILRRAEEALEEAVKKGGNRIHRHTCGQLQTTCTD